MQKVKHIFIILVLALMMSGCDGDNQSPQSGSVNTETPHGQDDTEQYDAPEDASSSDDDEEKLLRPVVVETKPSNWYIRLVAEDPARAMKTGSTQLGELNTDDNVSKHILGSLQPSRNNSYLDIVFIDPSGVASGEYKSYFHYYQENSEDSWTFTVKTDDSNAEIVLTWRGLYVLEPYVDNEERTRYHEYRSMRNPLLKQMKLVDTVNGKEIPAIVDGQAQVYTFTMDGETQRTFEWVLKTEEVSIPSTLGNLTTLQAKVIQKDVVLNQNKIIKKKVEPFDLSKPPTVKEEEE